MSAISQILLNLNNEVKGADVKDKLFTENNLITNNIQIDDLEHMDYKDSDVIVVGNAFLDKYRFENKKVITYQELLSTLNDQFYSIAVCGSHGKTTTTNMIKHVLSKYYIINYLVGDGTGKANIDAKYFVYEACEHRDHFLSYHPNIIVCTNIDYDHVEYFKDKKQYNESFYKFFDNCKDTLILNDTIKFSKKGIITYGMNNATIQANNINYKKNGIYFDLSINQIKYKNIFLPFYGKHILNDALACISCCLKLNLNATQIIDALQSYQPANRRYKVEIIESNIIIDDYGHHPNEIKATINAIKQQFKNKKLIIIYHPDRPKRLLTFLNEFQEVLNLANQSYILPFLNNNQESKAAFEKIIDNKKIKAFSKFFYNNDYKNTVFLFTGSKEMNGIISYLKEIL